MKIVKYLFFLILIFVIAGSIYVATKQGDYEVEREIIVDAPVNFVFSEVNNLENWETWGPWASEEGADVSSSSINAGEGAHLSWRSESKGGGSITTTNVVPNEQIQQEISLDQSFGESKANAIWLFEEVENGTKVILRIEGTMDFKEKLHWETRTESIEDYFVPMFEQNLVSLDEDLQTQMSAYSINVHGETEYGGGYFMYSSTSTRLQNVQKKFKELLPQIEEFMRNQNISENGKPFILYHDWNEENGTALFSVAIPTPTKVVTPGDSNVLNGFLPNQKVVRTTLRGDRKNLQEAWDKAFEYIKENNLVLPDNYKPFEVYITAEAKDVVPSNLITEIYIPVEEPRESEYNTTTNPESFSF